MSISDAVQLIYAVAALTGPAVIAWGLYRLSKAIEAGRTPSRPPAMPDLPPPSQEDMDKLVERFRAIKEQREAEYGQRAGFPAPSNTRPGRHVFTPE